MQIELHVPSVRNAEIKGSVHKENPVTWMCIWLHALETAWEDTLGDAAVCFAITRFCVVSYPYSSETSQLSQMGRRCILNTENGYLLHVLLWYYAFCCSLYHTDEQEKTSVILHVSCSSYGEQSNSDTDYGIILISFYFMVQCCLRWESEQGEAVKADVT